MTLTEGIPANQQPQACITFMASEAKPSYSRHSSNCCCNCCYKYKAAYERNLDLVLEIKTRLKTLNATATATNTTTAMNNKQCAYNTFVASSKIICCNTTTKPIHAHTHDDIRTYACICI